MNKVLNHEQFSSSVKEIHYFQQLCFNYLNQYFIPKCEIKFPNLKNNLNFGVYRNKQGQFFIKFRFKQYNFQEQIIHQQPKNILQKPKQFRIYNQKIIQELQSIYQKQSKLPIYYNEKINQQFQKYIDKWQFQFDQFVLQLQVYENYPLLRQQYYIPIYFTDHHTKQPFQALIFSNSNKKCMYSHFIGYKASSIKYLQGANCNKCGLIIQQLQQNKLLMYLHEHLYNPLSYNIMYCSQYNRFKLIKKIKTEEQDLSNELQSQIHQLSYYSYWHFRSNIKKITCKYRNNFTMHAQKQQFSLKFILFNRQLIIKDPVRGKFCSHYSFTDLRLFYLNIINGTKTYQCPICFDVISDFDIMYLKQTEVLIQYFKYKIGNDSLKNSGKIIINHLQQKVYLQYLKDNSQNMEEINNYYATLIDPFIGFDSSALQMIEKPNPQFSFQNIYEDLIDQE